ncbi:hypothetical protein EKI60_04775 [Candidatus Saccharibacteria bacterium]|nr:MAG: hypothetical protein EKI60_04775 [Candidatus Saccharibacteria bacterium]
MARDNELKYLVGMTEEMALVTLSDTDAVFRVVRRGDVYYPVTRDWRPERINIEFENNKVSRAYYA